MKNYNLIFLSLLIISFTFLQPVVAGNKRRAANNGVQKDKQTKSSGSRNVRLERLEPQNALGLLDIPLDIQCYIYLNLDIYSLFQLKETCKTFPDNFTRCGFNFNKIILSQSSDVDSLIKTNTIPLSLEINLGQNQIHTSSLDNLLIFLRRFSSLRRISITIDAQTSFSEDVSNLFQFLSEQRLLDSIHLHFASGYLNPDKIEIQQTEQTLASFFTGTLESIIELNPLTELHVVNTSKTDEISKDFEFTVSSIDALLKKEKLRELEISGVKLSSKNLTTLLEKLSNQKFLSHLTLDSIDVNDPINPKTNSFNNKSQKIFEAIHKLESVRYLSLVEFTFLGDVHFFNALQDMLKKMSALQKLRLSYLRNYPLFNRDLVLSESSLNQITFKFSEDKQLLDLDKRAFYTLYKELHASLEQSKNQSLRPNVLSRINFLYADLLEEYNENFLAHFNFNPQEYLFSEAWPLSISFFHEFKEHEATVQTFFDLFKKYRSFIEMKYSFQLTRPDLQIIKTVLNQNNIHNLEISLERPITPDDFGKLETAVLEKRHHLFKQYISTIRKTNFYGP